MRPGLEGCGSPEKAARDSPARLRAGGGGLRVKRTSFGKIDVGGVLGRTFKEERFGLARLLVLE